MKLNIKKSLITGAVLCALTAQSAFAAIALDRTRVIYDGSQQSLSLSISNENKQLPYLAQGWIEDAQGNKITNPLMVLPPVQRIEPGAKSQVKVQGLPSANSLPQDRESLFYFNLREIPPRSNNVNTLQIALQTRIKLFYRPKALIQAASNTTEPWQEKITLIKQGDSYVVNNPTAYFVTLVEAAKTVNSGAVTSFEPLMVAPHGKGALKAAVSVVGNSPVLTYINDYGGRLQLKFNCSGNSCQATPVK